MNRQFHLKPWKCGMYWVVFWKHLRAFLKIASLCNYIYRTKKSNSATIRAVSQPTRHAALPHTVQQTGQRQRGWSSFLLSSSCYNAAWHSIGAALCVCTVIWWETRFLSLCPLWLDPGHVSGWEMKRRRSGRIQSLSSGFKARFTHSLWTVVFMKCLWMCLWSCSITSVIHISHFRHKM